MKHILKSYLKRLTNLTSRNRSLVLLRLPKRQFIDLHALDFLLNKPSFNIINQLIERQSIIPLCDFLDPRSERSNEKSKHLAQVSRTEKLIIEERGAEDLYVGYPIVKGKFSDGTVVRCPLLFFPVSLGIKTIQKKNVWCLVKRESDITFNRSFLLAYAHFNNTKIPDEWLDFSFDDFPKDSLEFRTNLYETLKETPLEINFNQELFQSQLIDFEYFRKEEVEESERIGELKLYPQAVLGIFPQAGSYVAADYESLLEKPEGIPEDFTDFFDGGYDKKDLIIREEELLLPLAVDASQEETIKEAKQGKSLVVQGPPGTGKSQLIANLIADFTARGKRVLVVCQKRAALDTVYDRLEPLGLAPFMALIHDFKNDKKPLLSKISEQIENIDNFEKINSGLDIVLLEREFSATCREIDRTVRELNELKSTLFDERIAGKSIKEMYLSTALYSPRPEPIDFSTLYHFFRLNELSDFIRKVQQFEQYQKYISNDSMGYHFWKERREATNWTTTHISTLSTTIRSVHQAFENFKQHIISQLPEPISLLHLPRKLEEHIRLSSTEITDNEVLSYFHEFHQNESWKAHFIDLKAIVGSVSVLKSMKGFSPSSSAFYENTMNADYLRMLRDGLPKTASYIGKFKWLYLGKYRKLWKQFTEKYHREFTTKAVEETLEEITNAENFSGVDSLLKSYEIFIPENVEAAAQKLEKILLAKKLFEATKPTFERSRLVKIKDCKGFRETCNSLLQLITESKRVIESAKEQLTAEQIFMIEQADDVQPYISYLANMFDFLIENDQLLASLSEVERQVLDKTVAVSNPSQTTGLADKIEFNLIQHWITHIEAQHPILRGVSTLKVKQLEEDLQLNIQKKQDLCRAIILMNLREKTYHNLEKNRLGNVTTYRELAHQATKKRQLWSIRKLVENFADELFTLIPCWLASPETVSAVFPMKKDTFDLIIFDEASQCYIEHGLPAALRGKQVIIAGDSQQLQPSDLYQVRFEEEQEDSEPLLEIDSLLDVASQHLPQTLLRGHYRSKSLDLISFSNHHFYNNKLSLLPDYGNINNNEPSIYYVKIEGVWDDNRNEAEARKVVEVALATDEKLSIGVVTFNFKQAELIDNLLSSEAKNRTNIRVKNIENIQGDEFDVVIFSVGYAPNKHGKLLMNFGTLNQQGGENRLNVAVTRARSKIYVIASILPEELRVESSLNRGPKLLQDYLRYALDISRGNFSPQPYLSSEFQATNTLKNYLKIHAENADFQLTEKLPFADLTLLKNGKYKGLILTDDGLYYDSSGSKDAHGYLPLLLKQKGWQFERKWSRNVSN